MLSRYNLLFAVYYRRKVLHIFQILFKPPNYIMYFCWQSNQTPIHAVSSNAFSEASSLNCWNYQGGYISALNISSIYSELFQTRIVVWFCAPRKLFPSMQSEHNIPSLLLTPNDLVILHNVNMALANNRRLVILSHTWYQPVKIEHG